MRRQQTDNEPSGNSSPINLFLCGDVMTGRGIDQILPHPNDPLIHERRARSLRFSKILLPLRHILPGFVVYKRRVKSAREYVELAEKLNGPIRQPVDFSYVWGDALEELERVAPDLRIINLETSITKSDEYWKDKPTPIHFRMHPENIHCITAAKIDCCSLVNNHILDWGYSGLRETLETLKKANVKTAGAGGNLEEAETPAVMEVEGKGRVIVFSFGWKTSGIRPAWSASENRPGVNLLKDLSNMTVRYIEERVGTVKRHGDIVIASIHWGGNWGYNVPREPREFAHKLIDEAGVDVIHGHSSHHVKGIEVYGEKLIMYGCGDLINDYEGITGLYDEFRKDLGLMYFVSLEPSTGKLVHLRMTPTQIKRLRVNRASRKDALWLRDILNREGKRFGTRVEFDEDNSLKLEWD